jgi:hypothetical protein
MKPLGTVKYPKEGGVVEIYFVIPDSSRKIRWFEGKEK